MGSFQTCTIYMFGSELEPTHSSHTEVLGCEGRMPQAFKVSMAYNNGPNSGSTTHLALSDECFLKKHIALLSST